MPVSPSVRGLRAALALAVLVSFAACGGHHAAEAGPDLRVAFYDTSPDSDARVFVEGVEVEIAAELKMEMGWRFNSADGSTTTSILIVNSQLLPPAELESQEDRIWVVGHRLWVDGHELKLGETSYGEVPGDATVRIERTGVHVGGELRGALPLD